MTTEEIYRHLMAAEVAVGEYRHASDNAGDYKSRRKASDAENVIDYLRRVMCAGPGDAYQAEKVGYLVEAALALQAEIFTNLACLHGDDDPLGDKLDGIFEGLLMVNSRARARAYEMIDGGA